MKPENRFISRVHDKLDPDIYREKMFNPLRGGTPDCYYMGYADDLWIEYKWLSKFPVKVPLVPDLSPLQLAWLMRAHDRGRSPWVVVGSPTGSIVITEPDHWSKGLRRDEALVISVEALAREIQTRCGLESFTKQPRARRRSTPSPSSSS